MDVVRQQVGLYHLVCRDTPILPSDEWATLIGDCVHNLRSALDYLAWELAGSNLDDRQIMFPICDTPEQWERFCKSRGTNLRPTILEKLKELQPFTQDPNGGIAVLSVIRDLDNRDKHQLLTVTAAAQSVGGIRLKNLPTNWTHQCELAIDPLATFADGEVFGRVAFVSPSLEVRIEAEALAAIVFGADAGLGPRMSVIDLLDVLIAAASAVVTDFEQRS
jgi:hypothetical protein